MWVRVIFLFVFSTFPVLAETPVETATTLRNTVLRAAPVQTSAVVGDLKANAAVDVFERQRLWVRAAPSGDPEATQGWLRFTELRIGAAKQTAAASAPTPERGGFAGFSRSVSGFLRGFRGRDQRSPQATTTIGIRGLTVAELQAAQPDLNALATVDRYTISRADAEQFAGVGGLAARAVTAPGGTP